MISILRTTSPSDSSLALNRLKDGADGGAFGVYQFERQADEVIIAGFGSGQVEAFDEV
jgi:hypothetical protein